MKVKTTMPLVNLIRYIESTPCHSTNVHYCSSHRLLDKILTFIQKEGVYRFLKLLFTKDQRITQIEGYHHLIRTLVTSFQVSSLSSNL